MVLSNAERQRRYRERLKAQAAGIDLVERAREAMNAAIKVAWAIGKRFDWADFDEFATLDDWINHLRDSKAWKRENVGDHLRQTFSEYLEDAEDGQREVLQRAIDLLDAVTLRY